MKPNFMYYNYCQIVLKQFIVIFFCIPLILLKHDFRFKKYPGKIQTRTAQNVNSTFLIYQPVLTEFLKIISIQNQIPNTFDKALIHINI